MEIKLCPICGNPAAVEETYSEEHDDFGSVYRYRCKVVCPCCGMTAGKYGTTQQKCRDKAIELSVKDWNENAVK